MSAMGKSLRDLIDEATAEVELRAGTFRSLVLNPSSEPAMKNWKAREYSILQQIHTVTGVPMEKIGVIGGENCVMVLMGVTIAQTDLPKLNSVLQQLGCLTHIIWL